MHGRANDYLFVSALSSAAILSLFSPTVFIFASARDEDNADDLLFYSFRYETAQSSGTPSPCFNCCVLYLVQNGDICFVIL